MDTILIIDDSHFQASMLRDILKDEFHIEICKSGLNAMGMIYRLKPDLILLDIVMPEIDGFEILTQIKSDVAVKNIPVILITSLAEVKYEEKGLLLGAIDYITKPFHERIVRARVQTHIELYRHRRTMENLALLDGLTGVPNRRYLDKYCYEEWNRAIEEESKFTFAMVDIDYFKKYNDTYGHLAGDDILRAIAKSLYSIAKKRGGMTGRYGGEEFGVAVVGLTCDEAKKMAEEMRVAIEAKKIPQEGVGEQAILTVSIGGITCNSQEECLTECMKSADETLYKAKENGRNRVEWKTSSES